MIRQKLNPIGSTELNAQRKTTFVRLIVCLIVILGWGRAAASYAQQPVAGNKAPKTTEDEKDIRVLAMGDPIEREIADMQSHNYQISLNKGQYLKVIARQRGVDLSVQLMGPDRKLTFEYDSELRNQGEEEIVFVTESSGNHRVSVQAKRGGQAGGRYLVKVVEMRAATEQEMTLQTAFNFYTEAVRLFRAGKYDEALPLARRALEIREKALGQEHLDVGISLGSLGDLSKAKGDYAAAESTYQRAIMISEKALGPDHPTVAGHLIGLANLYLQKGDYGKAEPLYHRLMTITEKELGPNHPYAATALNGLGNISLANNDFTKAASLLQRGLEITERSFGPDHRAVSASMHNLARVYKETGDYTKAEPLYQRALELREKALGPDHPEIAIYLTSLANLYEEKGDSNKAEAFYQRAQRIREKTLGPNHPDLASGLYNLGLLYWNRGDYLKVEPLYQRALEIWEKALDPNHPYIALALNGLALVHRSKGDYVRAEPLFLRALIITEKASGADHLDLAWPLNNLALLYLDKGDVEKAEPLFQRVLTIREKALGPDHRDVAASLSNLALLYSKKGDDLKAAPLFQRAISVWEKSLGPDHPDLAKSLDSLARLYLNRGDQKKAEPLLMRALAIWEKASKTNHPDFAFGLNDLATINKYKGDYNKAEASYQRALLIREETLGPDHPYVASLLSDLARLYVVKGDLAQAITTQSRANAIAERNLNLNLAIGSERQKSAYLELISGQTDQTLSLHLHSAPRDSAALRMAFTTLLQRKGRSLDAMTEAFAQLRRRAEPQDQTLFDQLTETVSQLANLTFKGSDSKDSSAYRDQLKRLNERKEKIEADLSQHSAEFRRRIDPVTLEAVQTALPTDGALVEIVSYSPLDAKTDQSGEPHYAVYALFPQGEPRWVDLGEAAPINEAIAAFREALHSSKDAGVKELARAVDEKVMRPVRNLLGQTRDVWLSPDGALNLVPFAALVDEENRYLVERYSFTYLTSGRDLLRFRSETQIAKAPMIVADPDFGEDRTTAASTRIMDLRQAYFSPLSGTAEEAKALKRILPQAMVLTRGQASETALKQVAGPSILHIATHGFFLADKIEDAKETGRRRKLLQQSGGLASLGANLENPLLRSGLGLAGANLHKSGDDDGILTAMEVAGLNLWGTKLVTLSACETGVGEIRTGEGVYGLRRALTLAGAETQVMSLWPVSDRGTRELMIGYYKALQAGQGRSEAMRLVQLRMLKEPRRRHPFYWASFIVSGEWANLDGKR